MVGPSSSRTAGAVRIGYIASKFLGEDVTDAEINLYGSFLDAGKGHGTQKGIVAGLMGMKTDIWVLSRTNSDILFMNLI